MKRRIKISSALLIAVMLLGLMTGCGQEEEQYTSPNFDESNKIGTVTDSATESNATMSDAVALASVTNATPSDATMTDALVASISDASAMGVYDNNTYFNNLAGFRITGDEVWTFFDEEGVASASGQSRDDIDNLWSGLKTPYDYDTSYAAIAYNTETGSNIIVSYINPDKYLIEGLNAESYLRKSVDRYEGVVVRNARFAGDDYICVDIPKEETGMGRRTQFAIDKEGLIVLITFTTQKDEELEEAISLFSRLN